MPLEYDHSDKELLKRLGKVISSLAGKEKRSLERLAYESELSKAYFYKIVQGDANPSLLVLKRIASALKLNIWKLFKEVERS